MLLINYADVELKSFECHMRICTLYDVLVQRHTNSLNHTIRHVERRSTVYAIRRCVFIDAHETSKLGVAVGSRHVVGFRAVISRESFSRGASAELINSVKFRRKPCESNSISRRGGGCVVVPVEPSINVFGRKFIRRDATAQGRGDWCRFTRAKRERSDYLSFFSSLSAAGRV